MWKRLNEDSLANEKKFTYATLNFIFNISVGFVLLRIVLIFRP